MMARSNDKALCFRYLHHEIDYEEEEAYLNQKSREGFELQGFKFNSFYKFKKSQSDNKVYKMDYKERYDEDYVGLTEDAGWTLTATRRGTMGVWYYFCRDADGGTVPALFTDIDSKLSMLRKVQKRIVFNIIMWIIIIIAAVVFLGFLPNDFHSLSFISGFIFGLSLVAIVLLIIANEKTTAKISILKKSRI